LIQFFRIYSICIYSTLFVFFLRVCDKIKSVAIKWGFKESFSCFKKIGWKGIISTRCVEALRACDKIKSVARKWGFWESLRSAGKVFKIWIEDQGMTGAKK